MYLDEYTLLQMTRQRIEQASRRAVAEHFVRSAVTRRPQMRFRLGQKVVRLGQWMMGQSALPIDGGRVDVPECDADYLSGPAAARSARSRA